MVNVKAVERETPESKSVLIWTDGASRGNGVSKEAIGAYGYYMNYKGYTKDFVEVETGVTNNSMELKAVIEALKAMKRKDIPIIVYTDSAYVCNGLNYKWYRGWRNNNWHTKKGDEVKNKEEWISLVTLYESFPFISIQKVKGHATNKNNIFVDEMLNSAMDDFVKGA